VLLQVTSSREVARTASLHRHDPDQVLTVESSPALLSARLHRTPVAHPELTLRFGVVGTTMDGMVALLTDDQVTEALGRRPQWQLDGSALVRTVELDSFPMAIQAVNRVAEIAENDNHHPDIDIRWRTLVFRLSTHSAGGITALDVMLAGEIDGVLELLGQPSE